MNPLPLPDLGIYQICRQKLHERQITFRQTLFLAPILAFRLVPRDLRGATVPNRERSNPSRNPLEESPMRALLSIALLSILSAPAFAAVNTVPEPETLALIGVGIAGLVASRLRNKKK